MTQSIPQCNPLASYHAQREAIDAAVARVLANGRYILGPEVASFEQEFAGFVGTSHALGVANGTDALAIALRAAGVAQDDIVLTVSHTAVATAVAIRSIGAAPLFVDVDPVYGLLDPSHLEEILDAAKRGSIPVDYERIRAIVPVHLYGRCADMPAICQVAATHGLQVIEDCAQAHGAQMDGRPAGTWGTCASFSFYPTKNLGAFGDAGALVSSDAKLIERARLLREYGWRTRYVSDIEGGNSRLDEMQAAILRVKLERLPLGNAARRNLAKIYRSRISQPAVTIAQETDSARHVYHQFVACTRWRDDLRHWLELKGIGTLVHYPSPIHRQPAYSSINYAPLPLPHTERWAQHVLSLPIFPELTPEAAECVANAVNAWTPPF